MEDWGDLVIGDRSSQRLDLENHLEGHTFWLHEGWQVSHHADFPKAFLPDTLSLYALMYFMASLDRILKLGNKEHQQVIKEELKVVNEINAPR